MPSFSDWQEHKYHTSSPAPIIHIRRFQINGEHAKSYAPEGLPASVGYKRKKAGDIAVAATNQSLLGQHS
jgi:hypothetical protein